MIGARIAALALMASLALLLSGLVALAAGLHGGVLVWSGLAMSAGAALAARDTLAPGAFGRGLMLALYTALCLAILAVVDGLMEHRRARYDWTQDRVFTLSDITRRVLGNLQGDVQLTVVYGASSPGRHLARDLLKQYQLASSRLRVRFLDPDLEPSEARRFGDAVQGGIVLEHSGRRKVVHRVEERELTLAMNALASREQAVIAFLAGPGQPSPDDRGVLGYTLAAAALEKENYRVVSVDSAQAVVGTTPVLLIVPYGKRDLSGEAATGIEALRLRGSSVLLLAEPGEERPILRGIVEKWGLAWQGAQATDPDRHLKGDEGTVVVQPRGDHPATGGLAETLLPGVTFFGLPAGDSEWKPLMALSAAGRSTLRQGGPGPTGALVVAAAAERGTGPAPGRRAVVGDTDFFTNGALSKWPVNRELFVNLTDWLSEREDLLGPWLETRESFRVTLTERQLRAAGAVVVLGMPGLLLLVGLYFWLEGRRG